MDNVILSVPQAYLLCKMVAFLQGQKTRGSTDLYDMVSSRSEILVLYCHSCVIVLYTKTLLHTYIRGVFHVIEFSYAASFTHKKRTKLDAIIRTLRSAISTWIPDLACKLLQASQACSKGIPYPCYFPQIKTSLCFSNRIKCRSTFNTQGDDNFICKHSVRNKTVKSGTS